MGILKGGFSGGSAAPYPIPGNSYPVQRAGTIMELLDSLANGSCQRNQILDQLRQRCRQIVPFASTQDVDQLLTSTTLKMGDRYFIYRSNNNRLMISNTPPPRVSSSAPDGSSFTPACEHAYGLVDTLVNSPQDNRVHDRPYTQSGGNLEGVDKCEWTLSSGRGLLLGKMVFSNCVRGTARFYGPN